MPADALPTPTLPTLAGKAQEFIVDPSFAQAFQVAAPTPRLAHLLGALPPLAVAPLPRLLRALLLLGAELARYFEAEGLPLPPWRHADALATRYLEDPAASLLLRPDGSTAGAARGVAAAPPPKPRRATSQQQVQLKLLKLGLAAAAAPEEGADSDPPSPPTPGASGGGGAAYASDGEAGSPKSVLQVR